MNDYTPMPHESRARFITGSIELIQRRDDCTLAEAEDTAIGEWERWMEWHNVRVRRAVVAEEPEWEYGIALFGEMDDVQPWATEERALRELQEAEDILIRRRKAGPWVPVKQEGAGHEGDS